MSVRDRNIEIIGARTGAASGQLTLDSWIVGKLVSPESAGHTPEYEAGFSVTIAAKDAVTILTVGPAIQYIEDHI